MSDQDQAPASRERAIENYENSAKELELVARHLSTAARHLRDGEIPRGCAHALAAQGHLVTAQRELDESAVFHASRSNPS